MVFILLGGGGGIYNIRVPQNNNFIDLFHRPCLCYQLQPIEHNMYVLL